MLEVMAAFEPKNIFSSITLSINVEPRAERENATPMRNVDVTKDELLYTNIRPIMMGQSKVC